MSQISKLIAALTGEEPKPKAESLTVECPECNHSFEVEDWRTAEEAGQTTGDDPEEDDEEDEDDEFEDSMKPTPESLADEQSKIAASLLKVVADRDSVGAKAHEVSPAQSVKIVQATKKIVENSPADMLAAALNKARNELRK
jgi:hypothetical protein